MLGVLNGEVLRTARPRLRVANNILGVDVSIEREDGFIRHPDIIQPGGVGGELVEDVLAHGDPPQLVCRLQNVSVVKFIGVKSQQLGTSLEGGLGHLDGEVVPPDGASRLPSRQVLLIMEQVSHQVQISISKNCLLSTRVPLVEVVQGACSLELLDLLPD